MSCSYPFCQTRRILKHNCFLWNNCDRSVGEQIKAKRPVYGWHTRSQKFHNVHSAHHRREQLVPREIESDVIAMLVVQPLTAHAKAADSAPWIASDFRGEFGRKTRYPFARIENECAWLSIHLSVNNSLGTQVGFQRYCCRRCRMATSRFCCSRVSKQYKAAKKKGNRHEQTAYQNRSPLPSLAEPRNSH